MQVRITRVIAALVGGGLIAGGFAVAASADADPSGHAVNPVALGEALRQQLDGNAGSYQFAISVDGRLELAGAGGGMTPITPVDGTSSVDLVKGTGNDAGDLHCRVDFDGPVTAALIVGQAGPRLPQLCAVLGIAYDAAAAQ